MTDAQLIARLRDEHVAASRNEAADRIEALIAERDAAESKLAKAVEALEEISEYDTGATAGLAYTAKHHLAEIKGENHE